MDRLLMTSGQLIGLLGIVLVMVSGVARLAGAFWLAGFSTGTLMIAGIAALAMGGFLLLWLVARSVVMNR